MSFQLFSHRIEQKRSKLQLFSTSLLRLQALKLNNKIMDSIKGPSKLCTFRICCWVLPELNCLSAEHACIHRDTQTLSMCPGDRCYLTEKYQTSLPPHTKTTVNPSVTHEYWDAKWCHDKVGCSHIPYLKTQHRSVQNFF